MQASLGWRAHIPTGKSRPLWSLIQEQSSPVPTFVECGAATGVGTVCASAVWVCMAVPALIVCKARFVAPPHFRSRRGYRTQCAGAWLNPTQHSKSARPISGSLIGTLCGTALRKLRFPKGSAAKGLPAVQELRPAMSACSFRHKRRTAVK